MTIAIQSAHSNILSFDVEEWFQVGNFRNYIHPEEWESLESRVEVGVDFILQSLADHGIRATFFLVGWVAERHKDMVGRIFSEGHDIGVHGYRHESITTQAPKSFEDDLRRAIGVVSDITGQAVRGYRAPSYTLTPRTLWAVDILRKHAIEYDSSIYPIKGHPHYGFPGAPSEPFQFENGLYEFPMSTFRIAGRVVPFGSGAYFRLLPFWLTHWVGRSLNHRRRFFTINIHPWELDPAQTVLKGIHWSHRFRHYVNLGTNRQKFLELISCFRFTAFTAAIEDGCFPQARIEDGKIRLSYVY